MFLISFFISYSLCKLPASQLFRHFKVIKGAELACLEFIWFNIVFHLCNFLMRRKKFLLQFVAALLSGPTFLFTFHSITFYEMPLKFCCTLTLDTHFLHCALYCTLFSLVSVCMFTFHFVGEIELLPECWKVWNMFWLLGFIFLYGSREFLLRADKWGNLENYKEIVEKWKLILKHLRVPFLWNISEFIFAITTFFDGKYYFKLQISKTRNFNRFYFF